LGEPPRFQSHSRASQRASPSDPRLATEDLPVALGELVANKYEVERVLGRGGAGIVVAARNIDLDERVALKFLRPDVAEFPEVVARFAREARAAVSIKNEHVCRVLDVGTLPSGAPFMVMEYLEGRDLYRVMRERGALPVAEAAEYVLQVCEALSFAHARGMVHRDIKPENIFLIEPKEGIPYVKVLDFGISKGALTNGVSNDSLVKTGALLGTPAYMSPEQIRATTGVDPRADIWAIGIVLYELLTARPAFTADSVPQMAAAILEQQPISVRQVRGEIPLELTAIVERCLSKKREDRPQNVAELATLLLPFAPKRARISVERATSVLQGKLAPSEMPPPMPVEAANPSAPERPARPWLIALGAIVLVGAGVVIGLSKPSAPEMAKPDPIVTPPPVVSVASAASIPSSSASAPAPSASAPMASASAPVASASASASAVAPKLPKGTKPKAKASGEVDLGF